MAGEEMTIFNRHWYDEPVLEPLVSLNTRPFRFVFPVAANTHETLMFNIGFAKSLRSITVYVDELLTTNSILINVSIEIHGKIYQIDEPRLIYSSVDFANYNAERFFWKGSLPISEQHNNKIVIDYTNVRIDTIDKIIIAGHVEI